MISWLVWDFEHSLFRSMITLRTLSRVFWPQFDTFQEFSDREEQENTAQQERKTGTKKPSLKGLTSHARNNFKRSLYKQFNHQSKTKMSCWRFKIKRFTRKIKLNIYIQSRDFSSRTLILISFRYRRSVIYTDQFMRVRPPSSPFPLMP
jgi:hypothetical protein